MAQNLKGLITAGYLEIDANCDTAWDVFNIGSTDNPLYAIQRIDEVEDCFQSDLEAVGYVFERAALGEIRHREALMKVYGITFVEN